MADSQSLVGLTVSHYRVVEKLGDGAWVLSTRLRTQSFGIEIADSLDAAYTV